MRIELRAKLVRKARCEGPVTLQAPTGEDVRVSLANRSRKLLKGESTGPGRWNLLIL
jgi:hypothetical protein